MLNYFRTSFRNFSNLMLDSVHSILQSAYVNSLSRTISHKWTTLLFDFIQMAQWLPSGLSADTAQQFIISLLGGLGQLLEELFKVQCAGSLHWLFVLIGSVIEVCLNISYIIL